MKTTQDLLDALRERAGSDRKAAALVGVSQPVFSEWRTRKTWPSDERALLIAELLKMDAAYVLAVVNGDRARSNETRAAWQRVADAFGFDKTPRAPTGRAQNTQCPTARRRAFADTLLQSIGLAEEHLAL